MKKKTVFSDRYSRQIAIPEIGLAGQVRIRSAKVLLIGVGGLGSTAGYYLAAAGVGTIGIVDNDTVDVSNLQRQIIHSTRDVGRWKVDSAAERLTALNPEVKVRKHRRRFGSDNAQELMAGYDFIIDATDNFASKFLIADVCHILQKPYSHGGIANFVGQTLTVLPGRTACYRCLFEKPPPEPLQGVSAIGPLGPVPGVIGAVQATEAIKFIAGFGALLTNRFLTYDALAATFRVVTVRRSRHCLLCGSRQSRQGNGNTRRRR